MRIVSRTLAVMASLALAASAQAEGLAVTVNASLPTGPGLDVTYRLSPHFNLRAGGGLSAEPTAEDVKFGEVKYDVGTKFGGLNALVDWHPTTGNFHLSGGVMTIRSPWSLKSAPASTYEINGTTYASRGVGTLTGELRMQNRVAPVLLVGWGNPVRPGKRWGFLVDLGVGYVGKEQFILNASGPLASDAAFRTDLAAEQLKQSHDHAFTIVGKVGISYQF